MGRFNRWLCTLFAVLCAVVILPRFAFAGEETLEAAREKIAALEAEIVKVEAVIAQADAQIAAAAQTLGEHTLHAQTAVLVSVATFTASAPAEGWNAWKRQAPAYKKAHPWEKILADNCVRDSRICKRTAPTGTVFYLPAPEIRVYVHEGVQAPEAIMLAPTADPQVFTLDPALSVVTRGEAAAQKQIADLTTEVSSLKYDRIIFGTLAVLFGIFFMIAFTRYQRSDRLRRECDKKIIDMGHRLSLYRTS